MFFKKIFTFLFFLIFLTQAFALSPAIIVKPLTIYHDFTGEKINGSFFVENDSNKPIEVSLRVNNDLGINDDVIDDLQKFSSLSHSSVKLEPGEKKEISYSINPPENFSQGNHRTKFVIQPVSNEQIKFGFILQVFVQNNFESEEKEKPVEQPAFNDLGYWIAFSLIAVFLYFFIRRYY